MVDFIEEHREAHGVESICETLPIAPSTYYDHRAKKLDPDKRSERAKRDEWLRTEIQRVYDENQHVYGADKVWRQLGREGIKVGRCAVERLMRSLGLRGAVRGRATKKMTKKMTLTPSTRHNLPIQPGFCKCPHIFKISR